MNQLFSYIFHMKDFFLKIYDKDAHSAVSDILATYEEKWYTWINFMYFAYIRAQKLYLTPSKKYYYKWMLRTKLHNKLQQIFNDFAITTTYANVFPNKQNILIWNLANNTYLDYHEAIIDADFLFADGIALQLSYFLLKIFRKIPKKQSDGYNNKNRYRVDNLNGTDFVPYFFSELITKYGSQKINVILYWSYPEYVQRTEAYFQRKWIHVIYYQDGYSEFDRWKLESGLSWYQDKINILLVARSHPHIPIQELRVKNNLEKIQKYKLITFTVWWLFDHLIWAQKRAPKLLRWIKLERFWRLITHPKRNYKKVLNIFAGFKYIFCYLLLKKR